MPAKSPIQRESVRGTLFLMTALSCASGAIRCEGAEDSSTGSHGHPCYPNGTCDVGLVCAGGAICTSTDAGVVLHDDDAAVADGDAGLDSGAPMDAATNGGSGAVMPCATISIDLDVAATPWVAVNSMTLPAGDGFDIDGIDNASTDMGGQGKTIPGCGVQDLPGGKDNALATLAVTLRQAGIDLNTDLTTTLAAAGQGGALVIETRLTHLSGTGVSDDSCVGAEIRVGGADGSIVFGSGRLADHVAVIAFESQLRFDATVKVPESSCNGAMCTPGAKLAFPVDGLIARFALDDTNGHVQSGSLLGGFLFFESTEPAFTSLNANGFKASLDQFFADVDFSDALRPTALSTFAGAQDLHMNIDRSIGPCTSPNGTSWVNKNSISIGLAITSL